MCKKLIEVVERVKEFKELENKKTILCFSRKESVV